MRPAMLFVDMAGRFTSTITVDHQDLSADAKSIMQMTMLAATCGTRLTIRAQGSDAQEAVAALKELVEEQLLKESAPAEESKEEG